MNKTNKNIDEDLEQMSTDVEDKDNAGENVDTENEDIKVLDKLMQENQKLKDDCLRAFAEVENTKKRCQQEIDKNNKYAISGFAKNLLSVADNLQRAIDAVDKEHADEVCNGLLKGIELTQDELTKVFSKFNIKKMDIIGTVFDPNFHQVIQEVEDKSKVAGTIIAEVQTGYMIHDRILREAIVVVTKA
jgi:molecular chaperone GrpE